MRNREIEDGRLTIARHGNEMPGHTRVLALVIATISGSILLLAVISTTLPVPQPLLNGFNLLCHGIEGRCLSLSGVAMPVCARCTGIYGGALLAASIFLTRRTVRGANRNDLLPILALLPLALDGVTQAAGLRESTNAIRLFTGALAGSVVVWWLLRREGRMLPES